MTYFVDGFNPSERGALLRWARDSHDAYDQWGWCINWLFDVCGELARRGETVPPECEYRPGALGPDVSEDNAEGLALIGTEALQHGARVLNRFAGCLKRAGEDY